MKLEISPARALCDEQISIKVSDLPPSADVTLSASLVFPWAKKVRYESSAVFTADADGNLDLSTQKPISGSYNCADGMGLILSLHRVCGKFKDVFENISIQDKFIIDIAAECRQDHTNALVERLFMTPEIKSLKINNEFVGELFYTENNTNKTIVFLGGSSNKELGTILLPSALLASHGFNVLALAFFGSKGLNSTLAEIPLEYFEKVFAWLARSPITHCKELYIYCGSIGGIIGLELASRYPVITKIVSSNPLAWIIQGLGPKKVSLLTQGGRSLPFIRFSLGAFFSSLLRCFMQNKPFGFAPVYRKSLAMARNKEEARIKVENSNADILLFGGQKDGWWDTHESCLKIMEELARHNYRHIFEHVAYENGGHACYPPFIIPVEELSAPQKIAPRLVFAEEGVTKEANAHMLEDSWKRAIGFFKK
jgi:pimeloyl-ACP methyl ester carboxylesterase